MSPAAAPTPASQLAPLASLLAKSEKALRRLEPGTWQHAMLRDNIAALRLAVALLARESGGLRPSRAELAAGKAALAAMARRARKARAGLVPGTAAHSLQRNRLAALAAARQAVDGALRGRRGPSPESPRGIS